MCDMVFNDEWVKTSVIISAEDARPFIVKALGARNAKYAGPATDDDRFKLTLEVYKGNRRKPVYTQWFRIAFWDEIYGEMNEVMFYVTPKLLKRFKELCRAQKEV